jgi:hypothetical protein
VVHHVIVNVHVIQVMKKMEKPNVKKNHENLKHLDQFHVLDHIRKDTQHRDKIHPVVQMGMSPTFLQIIFILHFSDEVVPVDQASVIVMKQLVHLQPLKPMKIILSSKFNGLFSNFLFVFCLVDHHWLSVPIRSLK